MNGLWSALTIFVIYGYFYHTVLCNEHVLEYLRKCGYLSNDNGLDGAIVELEEGLIKFQEYYNLLVSGVLDDETSELMGTHRCDLRMIQFL